MFSETAPSSAHSAGYFDDPIGRRRRRQRQSGVHGQLEGERRREEREGELWEPEEEREIGDPVKVVKVVKLKKKH